MANENTATVLNHDVKGLYVRFNRFITEVGKAASGNTSAYSEADKSRARSYLNAIRSYSDWIKAQPRLDLPKTSPQQFVLAAAPAIDDTANPDVNDVVTLMVVARDELIASESARNSSGLIEYDETRMLAVLTKVENFFDNYVDKTSPIDTPETVSTGAATGS